MINVSEPGHGIAVGHCVGAPKRSLLWTTTNGGKSWERLAVESVTLSRRLPDAVWPPEKIDSEVISADNRAFFAWTDPWLFDVANSHLLSVDVDTASKYHRIDDMSVQLSTTRSNCVRAFGFGYFWETTTSRDAWERRPFSINWESLESCFDSKLGLLRWPQFVTDADGFALVAQRHLRQSRPPVTGLARTKDGGHHWDVISQWDGPVLGDMNERHVTALKIVTHAERNTSVTQSTHAPELFE